MPRARRGVMWGAALSASLLVPTPIIAAAAAVDAGNESNRAPSGVSRVVPLSAGEGRVHQGSSRRGLDEATVTRVIGDHDAPHALVRDHRPAACRWWEAWCKSPVKRCTKTGSQWAIVGAIGGGVAGVWTGPTVAMAAGAGGVGGAISGCVAGIFRW